MDFEYYSAFAIPFFFLKKLGMLQKRSSSWLYRLYGLFIHLTIIEITSYGHSIYLYQMFMAASVKDLSEVLSVLFLLYGVILKTVWFWMNLEKIEEMLHELAALLEFTSFGRLGKQPKLEARIRMITNVSKFYFSTAFSSIVLAGISINFRYQDRRMPYETRLLWDYKSSDEIYWFSVMFQMVISLIIAFVTFSFDIIPVVFIGLTSALLDELLTEIASIKDKDGLEKLQQCIECHIKIKKFTGEISRHLSFPFLIQTCSNTVILCTSAFLLTMASKTYRFLLILINFCVFI